MGVRREGREAAVQYLYQCDLNGGIDREAYYKMRGISPSARRFCDSTLDGFEPHRQEIDELVRKGLRNYELERLSAVDRNVLRIAAYEILFSEDVPGPVAINEAIEIARRFSTTESGKFVNGVLDQIQRAGQARKENY